MPQIKHLPSLNVSTWLLTLISSRVFAGHEYCMCTLIAGALPIFFPCRAK